MNKEEFINSLKELNVEITEDKLEPIVLPKNAANFLNTETEYLRYLHEWEDGAALDVAEER